MNITDYFISEFSRYPNEEVARVRNYIVRMYHVTSLGLVSQQAQKIHIDQNKY